MTKEEALKKIKELEHYIDELERQSNLDDDEIFLLSSEEYEKYKDVIPHINQWWWLRSPGSNQSYAASVWNDGSVDYGGDLVHVDNNCVRPALRIEPNNLQIGSGFVKYDFPWIKIADNLAIAEVPIGFEKFDNNSNDYETSNIRKWLKNWLKVRR